MKTILLILALAASPVYAGGPVIEDAYEAEPAPRMTAGEKLAVAAGLLLIIAIASGGGSDVCNGPDDVPPQDGGC